ncbi:hypothetical protein [Actinomycetospora sp.]|jgi:hypothetical protein|uniref:hypothetical protein n=1 Tax=Actinomycetospora sp. TaxID=1872135 RepID=UPI002F42E560
MGIFGRRTVRAPERPRDEIIIADSTTLARASELLAAFERQASTGGTRDGMDAAVIAINRAGARTSDPAWAHSEKDFMVRYTECVADGDKLAPVRVWSWLAAVTESAAERGDHRLAARCVGFATWWLLVQTPQMSPAAEMAMRLEGGVPDVPCGRLLTVGLRVIPLLPPDELLIDDAPSHENTVSARAALRVTAFVARNRTAHLAPDVAGLPARILAG